MHGRGYFWREGPEEVHADLVGAGEDDAVDPVVLAQLRPDAVARAHDQVEDAGRHARVAVGLHQGDAAHRAGAGRLEDDRVAGQHGRRRRACRECHGEVEGRDDGEDAERAKDRAGVDGGVTQVVHGVVVRAVVLPDLGVVADEVGRLLDLAERLEPVLADLDGHQAGVLHLALADQLGRRAQDAGAAPARAWRPSRAGRRAPRRWRRGRPGGRPWRRSRRGSRGRSASAARRCRRHRGRARR